MHIFCFLASNLLADFVIIVVIAEIIINIIIIIIVIIIITTTIESMTLGEPIEVRCCVVLL
jgi:hypothetical protein